MVSPAAADELLKVGDRILIDVRTPEEFAAGHLSGAKVIDFRAPDFKQQIATLPRDAKYVIYCHSGNRSGQARNIMADLGFSDVADIEGGITRWLAVGLPTEK